MMMVMSMRMIVAVFMRMIMAMVVIMTVVVGMIVVVAMRMIVSMVVIMTVVMGMIVIRMQICHVMIMVFMFLVQHDIEITCVQRGLLHPADHNTCTFQMKAVKRAAQHLLVRSKIEQCSYRHVTADAGGSVEYQYSLSHFP